MENQKIVAVWLTRAEREIEQEKSAREQSAPAKEHDLRLHRKRKTSAMER